MVGVDSQEGSLAEATLGEGHVVIVGSLLTKGN